MLHSGTHHLFTIVIGHPEIVSELSLYRGTLVCEGVVSFLGYSHISWHDCECSCMCNYVYYYLRIEFKRVGSLSDCDARENVWVDMKVCTEEHLVTYDNTSSGC